MMALQAAHFSRVHRKPDGDWLLHCCIQYIDVSSIVINVLYCINLVHALVQRYRRQTKQTALKVALDLLRVYANWARHEPIGIYMDSTARRALLATLCRTLWRVQLIKFSFPLDESHGARLLGTIIVISKNLIVDVFNSGTAI